ncbi:MAG: thiamine-phosphate kinase [Actinomycetota bacterium]|nr:thiamine-phosphate kinase [Actinomycetota bacterium]
MSSEFALISALRPLATGDEPGVPLGVGDDAAVVEVDGVPVAITIDAMVEGVHFDLDISSFSDVGWRALATNVSDLAAVGARTAAAVVALERPATLSDDDAIDLHRGLRAAAERWGVRLLGGDIVNGPTLAITVSALGPLAAGPILRRSGARLGDAVVVAGPLGEAAAGLALRRAGALEVLHHHPGLLAAHRRPVALPEVGAALAAAGAHSCIDISDGLGQDLSHVASASGVQVVVEAEQLPISPGVAEAAERLGRDPLDLVCGGGDDLALAATLDPADLPALVERLDVLPVVWHRVGEVVAGGGVALRLPDGSQLDLSGVGYEHGRLPEAGATDQGSPEGGGS